MTPRVKLIFNPRADRGRSSDLETSVQHILDKHDGVEWSTTEYPTHATELAEQAARDGHDVVAAIGGDGTVHEVINGLMRIPEVQRPLLGSVPIGSGNDFSSNVGVAEEVEVALERVFNGKIKTIDIGLVTDDSGRSEYWNNTIGIGFDAAVTVNSYKITRLQGFTMYLWAVIQTIVLHHHAPRMKLVTDQEEIDENVLMFVACNGPREGGGFYVAPDAVFDDGLFHYAMIENVSRPMMFRLIPEVMNGTHGRFKQVHMGHFRELQLTSEDPVTIHTDGEVFAGFDSTVTGLQIKILPNALRVIT
ncbi:MAG TPA: diacylglycerol kinase family protein [Anaerolineales bacterium]|nr:diacylglycerol kinase family protein [Anaerolineales bacterium]